MLHLGTLELRVVGDLRDDDPTQVEHGLGQGRPAAAAVDHVTQPLSEAEPAQRLRAPVGVLHPAGGGREDHEDVVGALQRPPGRALEVTQDVFVVLTPTAGGIQDAYRSTQALRRLGLRHRLRYVVNRHRAEPLIAEAMGDLGGVVIAAVPDDPALELAEMEHRLLGLEARGRTAAALRALAGTVDARVAARVRSQRPPLLPSILRRRAG